MGKVKNTKKKPAAPKEPKVKKAPSYEVEMIEGAIIVKRGAREFKVACLARTQGEIDAAVRLGLAKLGQYEEQV